MAASMEASVVTQREGNGRPKRERLDITKDVEKGQGSACPDIHVVKQEKPPGINFFEDCSPLADQVGGHHYRQFAVQPFRSNFMNFGSGCALGEIINRCYSFYATDDIEELDKIIHECRMFRHLTLEKLEGQKCPQQPPSESS